MTLEVSALHSADVDELRGGPALGRYRLASLAAHIECLRDGRSNHLSGLLHSPALRLDFRKFRHMGVDEVGLVAFEHGRESMLAHGSPDYRRKAENQVVHRDIKTTQIYADYQPDDRREAELVERAFSRGPNSGPNLSETERTEETSERLNKPV